MKKPGIIALGIGLALALSGCLIVVTPPKVELTGFVTSWEIASTGEDVICDNKNTDIYYQFSYDQLDDIISWQENWTGQDAKSPTYTAVRTPSGTISGNLPGTVNSDSVNKLITVKVTFTPGTPGSPYPSPFNVNQSDVTSQSINVTPVPFPPTSETGAAFVTITVKLKGGGSVTLLPTRKVKVYSGC